MVLNFECICNKCGYEIARGAIYCGACYCDLDDIIEEKNNKISDLENKITNLNDQIGDLLSQISNL